MAAPGSLLSSFRRDGFDNRVTLRISHVPQSEIKIITPASAGPDFSFSSLLSYNAQLSG
jgi:hypothetical protein